MAVLLSVPPVVFHCQLRTQEAGSGPANVSENGAKTPGSTQTSSKEPGAQWVISPYRPAIFSPVDTLSNSCLPSTLTEITLSETSSNFTSNHVRGRPA